MKTIVVFLILNILAIRIGGIYAQLIKDTTVVDFQLINKTIKDKINEYDAKDVLVVLDIDNTILTNDNDLGSDIWYRWQRGKLSIQPRPEQKLTDSCLFYEAIALLYELGTMTLTDPLLPRLH